MRLSLILSYDCFLRMMMAHLYIEPFSKSSYKSPRKLSFLFALYTTKVQNQNRFVAKIVVQKINWVVFLAIDQLFDNTLNHASTSYVHPHQRILFQILLALARVWTDICLSLEQMNHLFLNLKAHFSGMCSRADLVFGVLDTFFRGQLHSRDICFLLKSSKGFCNMYLAIYCV